MKERNERIFRNSTSSLEGFVRKDFRNLKASDLFHNCQVCMGCSAPKVKKSVFWNLPRRGMLKLNVDGAVRGKPGPAGIGGVLHND